MKFLTKNKTLLISFALVGIPLLIILIQETCNYQKQDWCSVNSSLIGDIGKSTIVPAILFLFFTLLTVSFRSVVFQSWIKFATWATPLMIGLLYLIINMPTSGFIDVRPALYALILYGMYFVISLIIIGTSWYKSREQ